jgi:hypothetical protein
VYAVWLLVYLPMGSFCVVDLEVPPAKAWPLLIPIALLIIHLMHPTLLGWLVFFVPTLLYLGVGVYYAISNNLGPHPQWQTDREGVVLGSVVTAAMLGACVALYAGKPKANDETKAT